MNSKREQKLMKLLSKWREAFLLMKLASVQSHSGHWDWTGQHGAGCKECIRAMKQREEANAIADEADQIELDLGLSAFHPTAPTGEGM